MSKLKNNNLQEENQKTDNYQKYIFGALMIIITVQIFILNYLHPLYADDWAYAVIWNYNDVANSVKLSSLTDIIGSQYAHYMGWGGRIVAHTLVQFFIYIHPLVFDIANTLVFVGLLYLIYRMGNRGNKTNAHLLALLLVLTWFAHPILISTIIWLTGSCNYLWCTFIVLLFIYPYYNYFLCEEDKKGKTFTYLFPLAGIIAGWTNENMSLALIFILALFLFMYWRQGKSIPRWATLGLVGTIVGCLLLLLAPGNFVRSQQTAAELGMDVTQSFSEIIASRLSMLGEVFVSSLLPITALYVVLLIYSLFFMQRSNKKQIIMLSLLFMAAAYAAFLVMGGAPIFPLRATFGINTFQLVAIAILYANIDLKNILLKVINLVVLVLGLAYYTYSYAVLADRLYDMHTIWEDRERVIEENKKEGNYDIKFNNEFTSHKKIDVYDLSTDSTSWQNRVYSKFYDINSVARVKE